MPDESSVFDILFLQQHNTRIVVLSTMMLGLSAGLTGMFLLLRKRSLLGDALSHATLPGVCLAFILASELGGQSRSLVVLLAGATVTGIIGMWLVRVISEHTKLKPDAAMGIVLSVFFAAGVVLLRYAADQYGNVAGLEGLIYGQTAAMITTDFLLILGVTLLASIACIALVKELTLLCFDEGFGRASGWPVGLLDALLLALVTAVTVVGLQAVGLILIIALLIIPPAAARFWTHRLRWSLVLSAVFGAASGAVGSMISAIYQDKPAGALIVLTASAIFITSMFLGPARGVVRRAFQHARLSQRVRMQHLMRAIYELAEVRGTEAQHVGAHSVSLQELLEKRSWTRRALQRTVRSAVRSGWVERTTAGELRFTSNGLAEARRIVRNHRLWEMYLIEYADIAPSHVDRDADAIEHILPSNVISYLESRLAGELDELAVPPSPHAIGSRSEEVPA